MEYACRSDRPYISFFLRFPERAPTTLVYIRAVAEFIFAKKTSLTEREREEKRSYPAIVWKSFETPLRRTRPFCKNPRRTDVRHHAYRNESKFT